MAAEADHTHRIHIDAPVDTFIRTVEGAADRGGVEERRSLDERFDTWTVLHPRVPALRLALAVPTLAWRLGLGRAISRVRAANSHLVMLTVTGRTTGVPRHVPVFVHELRDEAYLWCPYGGRAQWYRNVVADPVVTVQSSEGTHTMRAVAVDDVDHLVRLVADLREFDETFLRSYLTSEGIEDTPEAIAANARRVHVRRLEPTTETGPPPLVADLAWAWLVPAAVIAASVVLRTRRSPP